MAIRKRVPSHLSLEAFLLYSAHKVKILRKNEEEIVGVVLDHGCFYLVKIQADTNQYLVTKDGDLYLSPFHCPYVIAVLMESERKNHTGTGEMSIHSEHTFESLLPYFLKLQTAQSMIESVSAVDLMFDFLDNLETGDLTTIIYLLEMSGAFRMYSHYETVNTELCLAMIDECAYRLDRILGKHHTVIEQYICDTVVSAYSDVVPVMYSDFQILTH